MVLVFAVKQGGGKCFVTGFPGHQRRGAQSVVVAETTAIFFAEHGLAQEALKIIFLLHPQRQIDLSGIFLQRLQPFTALGERMDVAAIEKSADLVCASRSRSQG